MRELQSVQTELRTNQRWMKYGGSAIVAIAVGAFAVMASFVAIDLSRIFALGDRLADVQTDTGRISASMDFVRDDVSEIKIDMKAVRSDLERVAAAVGAKLDEKAELRLPE